MILVDTSAWIDFFRGAGGLCDRVDALLETDEAALCGPVVTELRRGLRSAAERRRVLPLLAACHQLDQPAALWVEAGELGYFLARRGVTVKTLDLLIAAYALSHGVAILAADDDFRNMGRAGVPLALAGPGR
ncbi:MAG: PIN domain-containing protein [Deltaproteobacteria bacterium]|nr:PIN domain-containing protein [Deltaproteobacteria bacterium]